MEKDKALAYAKKCINKEPMPSSLKREFVRNGWGELLEKAYRRTAELVMEQENVSKAQMAHLEQILPCIAFYEVLLKKEGSKDTALAFFEKWCFLKIEKMAKMSPVLMKIPGLYKKADQQPK